MRNLNILRAEANRKANEYVLTELNKDLETATTQEEREAIEKVIESVRFNCFFD